MLYLSDLSRPARLAQAASPAQAYVVEGGIQGWKQAGLPTVEDRSQPLPLMRQVHVGAGLLFAGVTGFCGMARLLKVMPWNRRTS